MKKIVYDNEKRLNSALYHTMLVASIKFDKIIKYISSNNSVIINANKFIV